MNRVRTVVRFLEAINERLGRSLAWLLVGLVLIQFGVVVARYVFSVGRIDVQESVMYLHVFVFMGAAGYTLLHNQHVRVDVFYNRMGERGRAAVDLFGSLFLLMPTFGFILYQSWDYVARSFALSESSPEVGGLPFVYVIKGFILVLAITMLLQGVAQAARSLMTLLDRNSGLRSPESSRWPSGTAPAPGLPP